MSKVTGLAQAQPPTAATSEASVQLDRSGTAYRPENRGLRSTLLAKLGRSVAPGGAVRPPHGTPIRFHIDPNRLCDSKTDFVRNNVFGTAECRRSREPGDQSPLENKHTFGEPKDKARLNAGL